MGEFVTVETDDDGVATLRLDRPPVNALTPQMWREVGAAAAACGADPTVRAVVVTGGSKVFAAGGDIKQMADADFALMHADGKVLQGALSTMARMPKISVAAINGYAVGGGCEIALACDFRYAADSAKLGQPEIQLGLIPGAGATQRLTRLIGVQKTKELVYSGDLVTAHEALDIGLVDRVLDADEVLDTALAAARRYAQGPFALRLAKQAIDEGADLDLDSALRLESHLFAASFATEDARAGLRSFVEHGPGQASFEGR